MALVIWIFIGTAVLAVATEFQTNQSRPNCVSKDHSMLQTQSRPQHLLIERASQAENAGQGRHGILEMPWKPGCVIGGGFGFGRGCIYAPAVQAIPSCSDVDANSKACLEDKMADRVTSYTQDIRSESDFSSLLDTTTSAEGGGWGVTVSTSVAVLTSSKITTSSIAYVLGASGEVKTTTVKNPQALQLTEGAKELLRTNPDMFLQRHSPYYIHSIVYGGSFLGSVTVNSKSTATQSTLDFAFGFSVNFGFFSVEASHKFLRDVQKRQSDVEMDVDADWSGGTGVHSPASATPEAMAETYQQWSDTWRSSPQALKIGLRRWIDLEEVQEIINAHDFQTQMLFHGDVVSPTIKKMLTKENGLMHMLQNSLARAMDWDDLKKDRTVEDVFHNFQFKVQQHMLALERMDELEVLRRQHEVLWGDKSWFIAEALIREFEDMKLTIGRQCDDGSRLVDGLCTPWGGSCNNGELLPVWDRTNDNQCGSCKPGYVLDYHACRSFVLSDTHSSDQRNDQHDMHVIADKVDGFICAMQRVEVEDLVWTEGRPAAATCKVEPEAGRWRMYTESNGSWADASCGSRCIETDYPISNSSVVGQNLERKVGASGVTRTDLVQRDGSICWLSTTSFFETSHPNEWAECIVKPGEGDMWEVQAVVIARESRTGAQCGATCLHDLPEASFTVEDEVVKQWSFDNCGEEDLGPALEQQATRYCFLTSMAVSHARDKYQRPACQIDVKQKADALHWRLKACNGWAHNTQTMCGATCVSFVNSVVDKEAGDVEIDEQCGIGYRYSHQGYWSSAFDLKPPFGKLLSGKGTGIDISECAAKCNSISGCKGFSLYRGQDMDSTLQKKTTGKVYKGTDCWVYNVLGSVQASSASTACVKV